MMPRPMVQLWFAILLTLALPMAADAQTCTPTSSTGINFGTINAITTPNQDVSGTITVSCSGGTIGKVARACSYLGTGNNATNKTMSSGANTINYNVYTDAARTVYYMSKDYAPQNYQTYTIASTATILTFTMYGRVFSGQTVAPGTYTGTQATVALAVTPSTQNCTVGPTTPFVTVNFQVIITASCSISATAINFGTVNTLASPLNATGNLTVACSLNAPYTIALNMGSSIANTIPARKMSVGGTGAGVISYQLYRNTGPTNLWGDGTAGNGVVYSGTGTATAQTVPVYAQVPAQAAPPTGSFKDTVTATITF